MRKTIKEIALWMCAVVGGLAFLFGCFSEVETDNLLLFFATRIVGLIGMVMLIAASNSTLLGKRITGENNS